MVSHLAHVLVAGQAVVQLTSAGSSPDYSSQKTSHHGGTFMCMCMCHMCIFCCAGVRGTGKGGDRKGSAETQEVLCSP